MSLTSASADVLKACPNLKYIGLCATGYNNIDLKTCRELGITVSNVPKEISPRETVPASRIAIFISVPHFNTYLVEYFQQIVCWRPAEWVWRTD